VNLRLEPRTFFNCLFTLVVLLSFVVVISLALAKLACDFRFCLCLCNGR